MVTKVAINGFGRIGRLVARELMTKAGKGNQLRLRAIVTRGEINATVLEKGYDKLKSHGVGKEISWRDWQQYIIQLINQGYCEIAFHKNNALQLTDFSKKVLFEMEVVYLTKPVEFNEQPPVLKTAKTKAVKAKKDTLFERLRKLRPATA